MAGTRATGGLGTADSRATGGLGMAGSRVTGGLRIAGSRRTGGAEGCRPGSGLGAGREAGVRGVRGDRAAGRDGRRAAPVVPERV
ncbi:hypothetical protein GCM10023107_05890 [Actinoplanes octamycinicus]|nr:hypothetical protein Aoc01nite_07490 [Actinoplanes octamycinicus]